MQSTKLDCLNYTLASHLITVLSYVATTRRSNWLNEGHMSSSYNVHLTMWYSWMVDHTGA